MCIFFMFQYREEQLAFQIVLFLFIVISNTAVLLAIGLSKRGRTSKMNFFIMHLAVAGKWLVYMFKFPIFLIFLSLRITLFWRKRIITHWHSCGVHVNYVKPFIHICDSINMHVICNKYNGNKRSTIKSKGNSSELIYRSVSVLIPKSDEISSRS